MCDGCYPSWQQTTDIEYTRVQHLMTRQSVLLHWDRGGWMWLFTRSTTSVLAAVKNSHFCGQNGKILLGNGCLSPPKCSIGSAGTISSKLCCRTIWLQLCPKLSKSNFWPFWRTFASMHNYAQRWIIILPLEVLHRAPIGPKFVSIILLSSS